MIYELYVGNDRLIKGFEEAQMIYIRAVLVKNGMDEKNIRIEGRQANR